MTEPSIACEWPRPGVACLWISNPRHRNAMNDALIERLITLLQTLGDDPACRIIVLRGRDGIFSAGRELNDLRRLQSMSLADVTGTYERLRVLNATFQDCPVPTLAVIERFAFGAGATIVSWCTMAFAEDSAFLCYPELHHGIVPSPAVMALLGSVPRKLALELLLTGRRVYAPEAARLGLINRAVAADRLEAELTTLLDGISRSGPNAARRMLRFIVTADAMSARDAMNEAVTDISLGLLEPDAQAGIAAFLDKRPAPWMNDAVPSGSDTSEQ